MELNKITIENYRSIRKIDLEIKDIASKKCMILLGINESGKSNILKAINSKDDKGSIDYHKDCNQEAENKAESININYSLIATGSWVDVFTSIGIPASLAKIIKFEAINRYVNFSNDSSSDNFWIWIKDKKDFQKYVLFDEKIQLKIEINTQLNESKEITNLLDKQNLEAYLERNGDFNHWLEYYTPKVIFWKAEDQYLINKPIDLNAFKQNTDTSIPLRNCFNIAGIEQDNIEDAIDAIINYSAKKSKLQKKLSTKVTEYINTVWSEHKIKISFDIDAMQLEFLVEEQDGSDVLIDVSQRSDGFKQFISILLNLSIENETGNLKNNIILLDEPEIHLHPSGQKYLRDELLKIAENNVVIYATHSIYMVDKKYLDRHYHVQKENGLTTVKQIAANNPYSDEVLYNALGTSILEHIEPNVLIVEGKTDRDIFNLYCKKFPEAKSPKISVISADGAKNIIKYTKFFNTKIIKGFALFDSDAEGKAGKKQVIETENYTKNNTFEINDILGTRKEQALEDLFNKKYLEDLAEGMTIVLDGQGTLISQSKEAFIENKKHWHEEKIKKSFMQKIVKLNKNQLKQEKYYDFFKKLILKIN